MDQTDALRGGIDATETVPGGAERALSGCGLKVHLLGRASERTQAFFLFEAEGFVAAPDLLERPPAPAVRVHRIGAYPVPPAWPIGAGDGVALRGAR